MTYIYIEYMYRWREVLYSTDEERFPIVIIYLFLLLKLENLTKGFPCSSVDKESACSAGDLGLMPGLGRSPEEANSNPLQYPCLENLMDRGAWWAGVHGVAKSLA